MIPTRWYRVINADGEVWCETSDEAEAQRELADNPDHKLQRLYKVEIAEWKDEPHQIPPQREGDYL